MERGVKMGRRPKLTAHQRTRVCRETCGRRDEARDRPGSRGEPQHDCAGALAAFRMDAMADTLEKRV